MTDDEQIVRLDRRCCHDGEYVVELPDGRLEKRKSETDWDRVSKMTDAARSRLRSRTIPIGRIPRHRLVDAEVVVPANKVPISIRLDPDVLDFFKAAGTGLPEAHQRGAARLHARATAQAGRLPSAKSAKPQNRHLRLGSGSKARALTRRAGLAEVHPAAR